jgi:hypothetical protein
MNAPLPIAAMQLTHTLLTLAQTRALIAAGRPCCIAGDAALLRQLPLGRWIGGTIPYFMGEAGGVCTAEHLFVTELPRHEAGPQIRVYDRATLAQVCRDAPEHGFTLLVLPAFSEVHEAFAQESPDYEDMYLKPLVGWVSGVHLDAVGTAQPQVVDGSTGLWHTNAGAALHVPVSPALQVHVDIVNLFEPGTGPTIEFDQGGFAGSACRIDGQPANLHDWMARQEIDTRLPLVADYHGAMLNVSIKALDAARHQVSFYAPVFAGVPYRVAKPLNDYRWAFAQATASRDIPGELVFCCNCILNYAYGQLEGHRTGALTGPMTFGEIGYQLLNQTLVHLSLVPA